MNMHMESGRKIESPEASPEQRMASAKETAARLKSYGGLLGTVGNMAEKNFGRMEKINTFAQMAQKAYNTGRPDRVDKMYTGGTQLEKMGALKATTERLQGMSDAQLKKIVNDPDRGRLERGCAKKALEQPVQGNDAAEPSNRSKTMKEEKDLSNGGEQKAEHSDKGEEKDEVREKGLTEEEYAQIEEETGWSDEIIESIGSMQEYEIYKNAGLVEAEIDGKKCLIRSDIDWNMKDAMGRTNQERAEQGLAPLDKTGKPLELHHIGQHPDSPLAELTQQEHRGVGNDAVLHEKTKESEIDRIAFAGEKRSHWANRVAMGGE